jgi:hypothetical protein
MRLVWTGFLLIGLFLIGWTTYEGWTTYGQQPVGAAQTAGPSSTMTTSDDGTPMPPPSR